MNFVRFFFIAVLILFSVWAGIASHRVPSPYARPLVAPYQGEAEREWQVRIPMDGIYDVGIEFTKLKKGEEIAAPTSPLVSVEVEKGGILLSKPSGLRSYGEKDVFFANARFLAKKGDSVLVRVKREKGWPKAERHSTNLLVRREYSDYAEYFLTVGFLRLIAGLAGVGALYLAAKSLQEANQRRMSVRT